nr:tetratricopeptide repeat protein 36 homolog isoform X1 [Parasteatoda tepidariorum]
MTSKEDMAILNSVFNPLTPLGECAFEDIVDEELRDEEELTPIVEAAKELEVNGVKAAECGKLDEAIEVFSSAIQTAPARPSGYNNRAQAYRLKFDNAGILFYSALKDLNRAIELSGGKGRTACLAYCQRAFIHRFQNREKEAIADFTKAKDLGSDLARSMLVQMNPYAALCNQMLRKVMQEYQTGTNQ